MLEQLFRKTHARYTGSLNSALLDDFASWLISAGYNKHTACRHIRRLKQAFDRMSTTPLEWETGVSTKFLSQAFAAASLQGTRCAVERFFTARRLLFKESPPDRFSPVLDRYRWHLSDVRGLTNATMEQHIATVKSFLAYTLSADAPLHTLSATAV
ncbi:MAG: integrase, partial [Alphaproteobacteria bacterium]|nr:integrase [Alphaproteobacteria bacterium]